MSCDATAVRFHQRDRGTPRSRQQRETRSNPRSHVQCRPLPPASACSLLRFGQSILTTEQQSGPCITPRPTPFPRCYDPRHGTRVGKDVVESTSPQRTAAGRKEHHRCRRTSQLGQLVVSLSISSRGSLQVRDSHARSQEVGGALVQELEVLSIGRLATESAADPPAGERVYRNR